jgi:hypothetical protein
MSEDIYQGATLIVTRYVGPADEGPDRKRWQFTPIGWQYSFATLTRSEVVQLAKALLEDAE